MHVPHACISLFGGTPAGPLATLPADALKDGPSNDGLMQRFQLIVWPDPPPGWRYVNRKPDTETQARTAEVYRRITAMDPTNPLRLQFDDEAQPLFEHWLTDLEQRIRDDSLSLSMRAHLAKYRSLMPSLALLFTLADGQAEGVPISQARLACEWCEYLQLTRKARVRITGSSRARSRNRPKQTTCEGMEARGRMLHRARRVQERMEPAQHTRRSAGRPECPGGIPLGSSGEEQ